jgi:hypothetical protein
MRRFLLVLSVGLCQSVLIAAEHEAGGPKASVHVQGVPLDVPALIGAEENCRVGNFLGRAVARHGDQVVVSRAGRLIVGIFRHLGLDRAGGDVVDVDAVRGELDCHDLGQKLEAGFGGPIAARPLPPR